MLLLSSLVLVTVQVVLGKDLIPISDADFAVCEHVHITISGFQTHNCSTSFGFGPKVPSSNASDTARSPSLEPLSAVIESTAIGAIVPLNWIGSHSGGAEIKSIRYKNATVSEPQNCSMMFRFYNGAQTVDTMVLTPGQSNSESQCHDLTDRITGYHGMTLWFP